METAKKGNISRLRVSEDVVAETAKLSALDVKGVAGLGGDMGKMSSKLRNSGAVVIKIMGDVVGIDIKIKIKSGERAVVVAKEVQKTVKENIQSMTGITTTRVNVEVCGVVYD